MGRSKVTEKLGRLLAFVAILFISSGLHLVHPVLHEHHHCHAYSPNNHTHTGFGFSLIEGIDECLICVFLANVQILDPAPAVLKTALDSLFEEFVPYFVGTPQEYCIRLPNPRAPPFSVLPVNPV